MQKPSFENVPLYVIMGNEEANEIALLALRQVGCDLPEDCSGIEAFTTDTLVRLRVPHAELLLLAVPDGTRSRRAFNLDSCTDRCELRRSVFMS